jgi:hypothetical protein
MRGSVGRDIVIILPVLGAILFVMLVVLVVGLFTDWGRAIISGKEAMRVVRSRKNMKLHTTDIDDPNEATL